MQQRFKTIKGFFGQFVHYKDGIKVGESWPSIFKGSYTHYDTDGQYNGYSDPGLFGSRVHHNEFSGRIGESWTDAFCTTRHYDSNGRVGTSYDGFCGITSNIMDDTDDLFGQPDDDRDLFTGDVLCDDSDW